jgi:hypothetical protein
MLCKEVRYVSMLRLEIDLTAQLRVRLLFLCCGPKTKDEAKRISATEKFASKFLAIKKQKNGGIFETACMFVTMTPFKRFAR